MIAKNVGTAIIGTYMAVLPNTSLRSFANIAYDLPTFIQSASISSIRT